MAREETPKKQTTQQKGRDPLYRPYQEVGGRMHQKRPRTGDPQKLVLTTNRLSPKGGPMPKQQQTQMKRRGEKKRGVKNLK